MKIKFSTDDFSEIFKKYGFCLSGTTNLSPSATVPRFIDWINAGYHGSMAYMQNKPGYDLRLNPQNFSPEANSIIFLGARYPKSGLQASPNPLLGIISSYAWGNDYHDVLRGRVQKMVVEITNIIKRPFLSKITIDSAPVLEKPLAQRAGLGWQGRNTCLISPEVGSFFFVAGIFTDIYMEPGTACEKDYCGTCQKCIVACPTGCILPNRTIDARRCISYLSIEHKGDIPYDLRPMMSNMIFGCDICQNVCPWNRKIDNSKVMDEFLPKDNWRVSPELTKIVTLKAGEFNQIYRDSPIRRTKRVGLIRNAAIALGNSQATEVVPELKTVLETEIEPIIRSHAAWALGRINSSKARKVLSDSRKREQCETVVFEIERILAA